ncbi:hypothetical protein MLD38_008563 [Melastoma candidum]|uniref:Uncharacterized protein n=1 Tax=Melastoma candidum TaxID=119954 RepID=A0ACB9RZ06_9MYRT|nr:hypothetical protein MLD38_008563 [Melastoma candidum]
MADTAGTIPQGSMTNSPTGNAAASMFDNFVRTQRESLRALFKRRRSNAGDVADSAKDFPFMSEIANSVVARCSRILDVPAAELCQRYEEEVPESIRQPPDYARIFIEFCSYKALSIAAKGPAYLSDKEFSRLTFDMMLAWEGPDAAIRSPNREPSSSKDEEDGDRDRWSLFISNSTRMAMEVDNQKTVTAEAFARIAPSCVPIADAIIAQNLFDALTASSSKRRLHFIVYDKYIRSLDKVYRVARNALGTSSSSLKLSEGEIVLDTDGTVPTMPVLQHIGISAWPGRLTLTNYAIYFESLGAGAHEKAARYDLATDIRQVIKPELTGPLGARLFDKAVMYKSAHMTEPVYFEFPEFRGSSRRDYWLSICREVLHAHRFSRKHNFRDIQQSEIIARAILGIFRCRASREAFNVSPTNYKTLLPYNLAECLPGGDMILEALLSRLELISIGNGREDALSPLSRRKKILKPVSLLALNQLGFSLIKPSNVDIEVTTTGDVLVGEINPLERAVKKSTSDIGSAEAAQATVEQVKVEGIDTNIVLMKELLFPAFALASWLEHLASWEDPLKSAIFLILVGFVIYRDWIRYVLPMVFGCLGLVMLMRRYFHRRLSLEAFRITPPPERNAVEQLLTLQDGLAQLEALLQAGNVFLLKIRALLFAVVPQDTERIALLLVIVAVAFAFMPLRYLALLAFVESYTRYIPSRRVSTERWLRRLREWWTRMPAAPVRLIKSDYKKNK